MQVGADVADLQIGETDVARESGVARFTAPTGELTEARSDAVTIDVRDDIAQVQREFIRLRHRYARLIAILRLIIAVMKL